MVDTAAHLADRVLPEVPVRQYVLSLPLALRYRLAFDEKLCSEVLRPGPAWRGLQSRNPLADTFGWGVGG